MADSKRQSIMAAFIARLQTILTTATPDAYETNAGNSVHQWRTTDFAQDELPALNVRDVSDMAAIAVQEDIHTLAIEIDCLTGQSATQTAEIAMRKLVSDVVKAIGVDPTFGGLAEDTLQTGETVTIKQEEQRLVGATLTFDLTYTTAHQNPYA